MCSGTCVTTLDNSEPYVPGFIRRYVWAKTAEEALRSVLAGQGFDTVSNVEARYIPLQGTGMFPGYRTYSVFVECAR